MSPSCADIHRADVLRATRGTDGYCGFAFPIDQLPKGEIRVAALEPRCRLGVWSDAAPPSPAKFVEIDDLLVGLDPGGGRLSGWLSSRTAPSKRCRIHVMSGDEVVARQSACLYRRDQPAGTNDPFHGFSILMPPQTGATRIVEADTGRRIDRLGRSA